MTSTFNRPFEPLEKTQGIIPSAQQHNQAVRALERMAGGVQPGQQVFGDGANLIFVRKGRFVVVEIFGDYISANPINEGNEINTDQLIYIAKPYLIRNSITSRNGKTYSTFSNASGLQQRANDTDSETQVVIPTYVTGDQVYAETGIIGGTGVTYEVAGVSYRVIWQDATEGGRAWSKKNGT